MNASRCQWGEAMETQCPKFRRNLQDLGLNYLFLDSLRLMRSIEPFDVAESGCYSFQD